MSDAVAISTALAPEPSPLADAARKGPQIRWYRTPIDPPLLRELILRTVRIGMLDGRDPVEAALATLLVDEFRQSHVPPFELPQPRSDALRRATSARSTATSRRVAGRMITRDSASSRKTGAMSPSRMCWSMCIENR